MAGSRYEIRRWILAILSVLVLVVALVWTGYQVSTTSLAGGLEDIPFNELINESIKGRVEYSRSLFQVGLLLIAALWGLLVSKKEEARLVMSDGPELLMFISGSALLILSLLDHSFYQHHISSIYAQAGSAVTTGTPLTVPDPFDPNINNFYRFQIYHLVMGLVTSGLTLFSAHKLKEKP